MAAVEEWVAQLAEAARGSVRPKDGRAQIPGLRAEVEILTDRWGVPHVYAENLDDLYATQGWLHARERLWQVDFTRRLAQGRLAQLVGEPGLATDRFFRTVGIRRTAQRAAGELQDDDRRIAEPYLRGFRAGAAGPPPIEYVILGAAPEFPEDFDEAVVDALSIATFLSFVLSTNWPFEIIRAQLAERLGPDAARELTPFAGAEAPLAVPQSPTFAGVARDLTEAALRSGALGPGTGSNNWVVSGSKSVTGKPLLANDPHLAVQIPAIWFECHLSSPELEAAGVSLPGIPGVVIGHNRRIAWGFTNTQADVEDLYLERLSPDGTQYEFAGEWHPVERIEEQIWVRGEDHPRAHEVRLTRHGPLMTDVIEGVVDAHVVEGAISEPLALRWIHHDLVGRPADIEAIARAQSWEEFRAAAAGWRVAGQNMIYADTDGNIGYQFTGTVPVRARGSGAAPLPGWTGDHEWTGAVPFEDLPSVFNPEQGFVATANHRVVDLDYPHYLTNDWEPGYRIRRIAALLTEKERLSHEDFARIHADVHSGIADELVPLFLSARVNGGIASDAIKIVEAWDRRLDAASVGGAIFNVWLYKVSEALFRERLGEELFNTYHRLKSWTTAWAYDAVRDILRNPRAFWVGGDGSENLAARDRLLGRALEAACEDLTARFGADPIDWRWGRLHSIHFRHPIGRAIPPLDELLSAGPFEAPGGGDTVNRGVFTPGEDFLSGAIASYRQIIDLADFDDSRCVISVGQSGNPSDPHHHDQVEMWMRVEYHPMPWTRPAVEAASEGRLVLEGA